MKINKILAIMLGLISVASQAYFWENIRQPLTQEEIEKRDLDLKYQEKQQHVAAEARKKQEDLNYKRSQLELQRKRDRLKLDR